MLFLRANVARENWQGHVTHDHTSTGRLRFPVAHTSAHTTEPSATRPHQHPNRFVFRSAGRGGCERALRGPRSTADKNPAADNYWTLILPSRLHAELPTRPRPRLLRAIDHICTLLSTRRFGHDAPEFVPRPLNHLSRSRSRPKSCPSCSSMLNFVRRRLVAESSIRNQLNMDAQDGKGKISGLTESPLFLS